LLFKGFPTLPDAQSELSYLARVSLAPASHRFPWFYNGVLETTTREPLLMMERIDGLALHEHFRLIRQSHYDIRFALLQYCEVLIELFDAVRQLHDVGVHHCDIKPDNVLFRNNLLTVIDFNGATSAGYADTFGTARYLPAYALAHRGRLKLPLNVADLQLTAICALEVLVTAFEGILDVPKEITLSLRAKDRIHNQCERKEHLGEPVEIKERDREYIAADKDLRRGLKQWAAQREDNLLVQVLCWAGEHPGGSTHDHKKTYEAWKSVLTRISTEDVYASATDLIVDVELRDTSSPDDVRFFCEQLSSLMTTKTKSVFQSFYPLIYLAYSESSQWYDNPARCAAEYASRALRAQRQRARPLRCLDVGCGFGTGAFQAAGAGFDELYCWDNSPVFRRLADLLWTTTDNEAWRHDVESLIAQHAQLVSHTLRTQADARGALRQIMEDKRASLSHHAEAMRQFVVADYWSLSRGAVELNLREKMDFIICNNFLHWPVKDFNRTKALVGHAFADTDLAGDELAWLLYPLLQVLACPGVLAIIEPTCFLQVDGDEPDFRGRFAEHPIFNEILCSVFAALVPRYFGFESDNTFPAKRPVVFRYADMERTVQTNFTDCEIYCDRQSYPLAAHCSWELVVMGTFPMMVASMMTAREHAQMLAGPLDEFFAEFQEVIRQKTKDQDPSVLRETFNVVYICKSIRK
jgi:SAM-dependent methyltransferase